MFRYYIDGIDAGDFYNHSTLFGGYPIKLNRVEDHGIIPRDLDDGKLLEIARNLKLDCLVEEIEG